MGFPHAAPPERLAFGQEAVGHPAGLATGRHHEHDPVAVLGGLAQHAATHDAFVVGMGMAGHECRDPVRLRAIITP
jgi:hypothetical protein